MDDAAVRLVDVYSVKDAPDLLYRLLEERPQESRISHSEMPSREEHDDFLTSTPYRYWYLIDVGGVLVGDVCVTDLNEVGVNVLREHQRKGYATAALKFFMDTHEPLPAIPAKRVGAWLANIATGHDLSKELFGKLGFYPVQETWRRG